MCIRDRRDRQRERERGRERDRDRETERKTGTIPAGFNCEWTKTEALASSDLS